MIWGYPLFLETPMFLSGRVTPSSVHRSPPHRAAGLGTCFASNQTYSASTAVSKPGDRTPPPDRTENKTCGAGGRIWGEGGRFSLPKRNSKFAPEHKPHSKGKACLPTTNFQGLWTDFKMSKTIFQLPGRWTHFDPTK